MKKVDEQERITKIPAAVVSITAIETERLSKHFDAPIGTVFYTVEFGDGSDAFVPEKQLEAM